MSIKAEIARINSAKTDIKTSLLGKGVSVPEDVKIDGVPALIDSIFVGTDTSDATANASEVFLNETAYVQGNKITGTFTILDEITTLTGKLNNLKSSINNRAIINSHSANILPLNVTLNGTYNVAAGIDGYNPVTVNVGGGAGGGVAPPKLTSATVIQTTSRNMAVFYDPVKKRHYFAASGRYSWRDIGEIYFYEGTGITITEDCTMFVVNAPEGSVDVFGVTGHGGEAESNYIKTPYDPEAEGYTDWGDNGIQYQGVIVIPKRLGVIIGDIYLER